MRFAAPCDEQGVVVEDLGAVSEPGTVREVGEQGEAARDVVRDIHGAVEGGVVCSLKWLQCPTPSPDRTRMSRPCSYHNSILT